MTTAAKPRRVGSTDATLLGAVLNEVDGLRQRVDSYDRVLAPAFASPSPSPRRDMTRGPGDHRAEPFTMRQASSRGDPWANDLEHSPEFLEAVRNGRSLPELRKMQADDAVMRAETSRPNPVLGEARVWCGKGGCRPATPCPNCAGRTVLVMDGSVAEPPQQRSVVHNDWESFPDHQGPHFNADARGEPGFVTARQHAPQVPDRPPGDVVWGL